MKKLILIMFCATSYIVNAQNSVSHNVVYDNPNKENLSISIDYFSAEFSTGAEDEKGIEGYGNLGYGIQASYMNLFNRMQVEVALRKNYKFDYFSSNYIDAGVTWDIRQKAKKKTTAFELKSVGNNKVLVASGIDITQMNRIRVRAGITRTKSYVLMRNIDKPLLGTGLSMETQLSNFGGYAGFEFAYNNNFKTTVSRYGDKRDKTNIRIYADVIATTLSYGDMYANAIRGATIETAQDKHVAIFDSIGIATSLGYRVGAKYIHSFPNGIALNVDANFGVRPPYLGIYGYLGTGITINIATAFQNKSDAKLED